MHGFFCIVILYVCLCVEVMRTLQILWWIPGARFQFCARVMRAWSPKGETIPIIHQTNPDKVQTEITLTQTYETIRTTT
jgi:hypothetical protein